MLFIVFPKTKIKHRKGETLWGVALFIGILIGQQ